MNKWDVHWMIQQWTGKGKNVWCPQGSSCVYGQNKRKKEIFVVLLEVCWLGHKYPGDTELLAKIVTEIASHT